MLKSEAPPAKAKRVLLIDDDEALASLLTEYLGRFGFAVRSAAHPAEGLKSLQEDPPDIVVLDVMLPGMDGFAVCRKLREAGGEVSRVPIVMLTARGDVMDRIVGLEMGADDYLPKPFELPVLLARVKGLLRRRDWARGGAEPGTARVGEADVDFANFEVHARGQTFRLTLLEAMLLKLLVQNAGRVVSKGEILEKVWNVSPDTATRAVDNFIMRLRKYIEGDPRFPKHLHTVRGAGYRLVP